MRPRHAPRAFTLIELLFVVAVIAILAAISVPNFLEAQVRSKIARVHSDMAVVQQAMRSYYADHNMYPPHQPEVHDFLEACSRVDLASSLATSAPANARYSWAQDDPYAKARAGNNDQVITQYSSSSGGYGAPGSLSFPILVPAAYDLYALTTPIAYVGGQLPTDPFHDLRGMLFTYINLSELQTTGTPYAQQPGAFRRYILLSYGPDTDSHQTHFVNPVRGPWIAYDPTNGTVSKGDIFVFGNNDSRMSSSSLDLAVENMPNSNTGHMPEDIVI